MLEKARTWVLPPPASRRDAALPTHFGILTSRTVRSYMCVWWATTFVVIYLRGNGEYTRAPSLPLDGGMAWSS